MACRGVLALEGNRQRLDGGAMYGNAPRAVWERWSPPDAQNRIPLACRCMLVEVDSPSGTVRVLLETGIGVFFDPALRERYGVEEPGHRLLESLVAVGLSDADVDIVVLSHLHFDHAGGLLAPWQPDVGPRLLFPNAQFLVGEDAWARAVTPHPRDRASFIPELPRLLSDSGRLHVVPRASSAHPLLGERFRFHLSDGHTPGLICTEFADDAGPLLFAADLIPGVPWVHTAITMGYDRYAELLIDEKTRLLSDLLAREGRIFFTHDPAVAIGTIGRDARGRFGIV